MSNMIYLSATGKKQGLISSGCSLLDSMGNKCQINHKDEVLIYSLTHSLSRMQNVNHEPVCITKPIDKSSPLWGMAISNNEELHLLLDFYRTSQQGFQERYYTVEVRKAFLQRVAIDYPHSLNHNDNQPQEMLFFAYKNITWTHHISGTTGYSIWDERIF